MKRAPKAGLQAIADAVGVSKMTVSRVLRGEGGFSQETEVRVRRAAEALGHVPNRIAAAFGQSTSSTLVGVCVPRLDSALLGVMLSGLSATFSRLGYDVMIGAHEHRASEEESWLRAIAAWKPAGIVLTRREHSHKTRELLRDLAMPIVEVWDLTTSPIDLAVGFSNFDDGMQMARYIVSRGRRKIGYVGAFAGLMTMARQRLDGFKVGLGEADLELASEVMLEGNPGFYAGYYGTELTLARTQSLDALYFHNDEMAIGGMAYLASRGIRIPDDIGMAGWGGMEAASILPRQLTTTVVPTVRLGSTAAEALVKRIRNQPVRDVTVVQTRFKPGATI